MTESRKAGLTIAGRILKAIGALRVYRDGDGLGLLFRWWHPAAWLTWIVMLPICGIIGERVGKQVPFRLKPYWQARKDKMTWL